MIFTPVLVHRKVVPSQWTVFEGAYLWDHFLVPSFSLPETFLPSDWTGSWGSFSAPYPPFLEVPTSFRDDMLSNPNHVRKELSCKVICTLLSGESGKGSWRKVWDRPDKLDRILTGRVSQTEGKVQGKFQDHDLSKFDWSRENSGE